MNSEYLLEPVLSDGERALIILQMARVAYQEWANMGGIEPDWDALPAVEKDRWAVAVRGAFRVMLSLMGEVVK